MKNPNFTRNHTVTSVNVERQSTAGTLIYDGCYRISFMKLINPFSSFSLLLPDEVAEDHQDNTVASYWITGDSCLLQLSSFQRDSGQQISAAQRLSERIEMGGIWKPLTMPREVQGCEAAAALMVDGQGATWVHAYLVWPWLTVHVTVSRQGDLSVCEWAWEAVSTIRPVVM